ncbi:uncharacterized protein [Oscarella lobularis]|uniref:uncharacterized protein isoform X2 n=1 Tax=Oscarella lobularis TaxID=121494 RepID=UPI0033131B6D
MAHVGFVLLAIVSSSSTSLVPLHPISVLSKLRHIEYKALCSPANQYVDVPINGSATISYTYHGDGKLENMSWVIEPNTTATRYKVFHSTVKSVLHFAKIDDTILSHSFKAIAYANPSELSSESGIVRLRKTNVSEFNVELHQERQLDGKVKIRARIDRTGRDPVSLALYIGTSKSVILLLKVSSDPDVFVTSTAIDSFRHRNATRFIFEAENSVRKVTIKANAFLHEFGSLLGCQTIDSIQNGTKLFHVQCEVYSYPSVSSGRLSCSGLSSDVFRLRNATTRPNHWLNATLLVRLDFYARAWDSTVCCNVFLNCTLKADNGWESRDYATTLYVRNACESAETKSSSLLDVTTSAVIRSSGAPAEVSTPTSSGVGPSAGTGFTEFNSNNPLSNARNVTMIIAYENGTIISVQEGVLAEERLGSTAPCRNYWIVLVVSISGFGLMSVIALCLLYALCLAKKNRASTDDRKQSCIRRNFIAHQPVVCSKSDTLQ